MEEDNEQENDTFEDDYYTFLNVPKNATQEEIVNAYRQQSKIYHPDKHVDPALKKEAEILFNRTRQAFQVLNDPHKRAIYDCVGVKGLETDGWEVVKRTKTPQEIREEFDRIASDKEQWRLNQRTNPRGNVTVNINATDLFNKYDDEDYRDSESVFSSVEVSGMSFSQSIEAPLTLKDTLTFHGVLDTHNGTGSGSLNVALKRVLSARSWLETEFGIGEGPSYSLKGYRTLTSKVFCTGSAILQFTAEGAKHAYVGTLGTQLDTHTVGYLTYKGGLHSSMSTSIIRNTAQSYTSVALQFGLVNSFVSLNYMYKLQERKMKLRTSLKLGTFGVTVEYGAEKKVSEHSSLSATVRVGVPTGVMLKIKLIRASQTYSLPIQLCEEVLPAPVFYATVVPFLTWTIVKVYIIDPVVREQKERDKKKRRELNRSKTLEKQREAKAAVDLMTATFSKIRAEEEAKKGLIISKALYGRFMYPEDRAALDEGLSDRREEVIDVTIPMQCLVKDSKLVLHNASKSQLPGFYDPSVGEEKQLLVRYLFRTHSHECVLKDEEPVRIPKQSHRVNTT